MNYATKKLTGTDPDLSKTWINLSILFCRFLPEFGGRHAGCLSKKLSEIGRVGKVQLIGNFTDIKIGVQDQ